MIEYIVGIFVDKILNRVEKLIKAIIDFFRQKREDKKRHDEIKRKVQDYEDNPSHDSFSNLP